MQQWTGRVKGEGVRNMGRSKYQPHQGQGERARRARQARHLWVKRAAEVMFVMLRDGERSPGVEPGRIPDFYERGSLRCIRHAGCSSGA